MEGEHAAQRLKEYTALYGFRDLISTVERKMPEHAKAFFMRLYSDLDDILEELSNIADQLKDEDEAKLRSRVSMALNRSGYDADAESHRRGHTDILVKCPHLRLEWIAETKRHTGYEQLAEGMKQLHTRYTNGRHENMGFLVFVFAKKVKLVMDKWKKLLSEEKLCGLVTNPVEDATNQLAFISEHEHEVTGLRVKTRHIFAGLYFEPTDKSAVGSSKKSASKPSKRSQPNS